jgi:hypothetical protein
MVPKKGVLGDGPAAACSVCRATVEILSSRSGAWRLTGGGLDIIRDAGCLGAIKFGGMLLLIAAEHRGARARQLGGRACSGFGLLLMPRDRAGNSVSDMEVVSSLSFKRPFTLVALSPFSI